MNKTLINSLSKLFDSALAELVHAAEELNLTADQQREEMIGLLARMSDTNENIVALGSLCLECAEELTGLAQDHMELAQKVAMVMDEPAFAPTVPYNDYVGHCDRCGDEITVDDEYTEDIDGIGYMCHNCAEGLHNSEVED